MTTGGRTIGRTRAERWIREGEELLIKGSLLEAASMFTLSLVENPNSEKALVKLDQVKNLLESEEF